MTGGQEPDFPFRLFGKTQKIATTENGICSKPVEKWFDFCQKN